MAGGSNISALLPLCYFCGAREILCVLGNVFPSRRNLAGFPSSGLVGVDNVGTTVYSVACLSFPRTTSWGGCCGGFLGAKKGVSSWGLASRETGASSSEPWRNMPFCALRRTCATKDLSLPWSSGSRALEWCQELARGCKSPDLRQFSG